MSFNFAKWNHLHSQGAILLERLARASLATPNLLQERMQLIERHQELVIQRQRLAERHGGHVLPIPPR